MNRSFLASLSLAVILGACALAGQPAEARYGVNDRQDRQQRRIYNGVRNGNLNRRETVRLSRQQMALNHKEARFRASGNGLSRSERARLQHQQNQLSRNIYNQKHDNQHWGHGHNQNINNTMTLEQRNRLDPSQRHVNRQIYGR